MRASVVSDTRTLAERIADCTIAHAADSSATGDLFMARENARGGAMLTPETVRGLLLHLEQDLQEAEERIQTAGNAGPDRAVDRGVGGAAMSARAYPGARTVAANARMRTIGGDERGAAASEFGRTLAGFRDSRLRMSQSRLAARAGFDHSYVSRLETGDRVPSFDAVERLAKALDLADTERNALIASAGFLPLGMRGPVDPLAVDVNVALATIAGTPDEGKVRTAITMILRAVAGSSPERAGRECNA